MLLPKTVFYRSRCHITPIPGIKISHFIFSLLHLTFHILIGKFSFWKDCNCIESIEWLGGVVTMRERDVLWWQDQSKTWLCMGPHSRVVGSCEPHQPPDVVAPLAELYLTKLCLTLNSIRPDYPPFCQLFNSDTGNTKRQFNQNIDILALTP